MAISRVDFGGRTLIDLTGDSVTSASLLAGYTAHGADGEPILGKANPSSGVKSWNGRTGSVMPVGGDYTDEQVNLSSPMHIGGGTQTNIAQALSALANNSGNQIMVHNLITGDEVPLTDIVLTTTDITPNITSLAPGTIYIVYE